MRSDEVDDARLERALRAAGRTLPGVSRDLADDVVAALQAPPATRRASWPRTLVDRVAHGGVAGRSVTRRGRTRRPRRWVVAAVVALAASTMAAGWLRGLVPGVEVEIADPAAGGAGTPVTREPTPAPIVGDLDFLGRSTTLADARARADHSVGVPEVHLPAPRVHVADDAGRTRVSLVYPSTPMLPEIGSTGVGMLLTQFRGVVEPDLLRKTVREPSDIVAVDIAGTRGWWLRDAHEVALTAPDGSVTLDRVRLADRVLLWTRDGITYRLESALAREDAIAIASSVVARR